MKITAGAWLLAVGTLCGCGVEASCPDGQRKANGACVEETQESSLESDASVDDEHSLEADASIDAGASMSSEGGVDAGDVEQNMSGEACFPDQDGDGHGAKGQPVPCDTTADVALVTIDDDCNDGDGEVFGAAAELCDGVDNDCDGEVDENVEVQTFYEDLDDDGYGTMEATVEGCKPPEGYALQAGDCDDRCETCFPGAKELCDDLDNDCDGGFDEGLKNSLSDVPEICDELDNNCNGQVDEGVRNECGGCARLGAKPETTCYSGGTGACRQSAKWMCDGLDRVTCPAKELQSDGRLEDCNTPEDDDCDGVANEPDAQLNFRYWFCDSDNDGNGVKGMVPLRGCTAPAAVPWCPRWVDNTGDCKDDFPEYRLNAPFGAIPARAAKTTMPADLNCDEYETKSGNRVGLLSGNLTLWKTLPECKGGEKCGDCAKFVDPNKKGGCYVEGSDAWVPVEHCVDGEWKPRKGFRPCG